MSVDRFDNRVRISEPEAVQSLEFVCGGRCSGSVAGGRSASNPGSERAALAFHAASLQGFTRYAATRTTERPGSADKRR